MADKVDCCKNEQPSFPNIEPNEGFLFETSNEDGNENSLLWRPEESPPSASADQDGTSATVKEKPTQKKVELVDKDPRMTAITVYDNSLLAEPCVDEYSFFEKDTTPHGLDGLRYNTDNQTGMKDSDKQLEMALHSLARTGSLKESSTEMPVERYSVPSGQRYDKDTSVNSSSDMSSESAYFTDMSASVPIVPSTSSKTSVDAANDLSVESYRVPSFLDMDLSHLQSHLNRGVSQDDLVEFWEALVADSTESCPCIISKPPQP
jgi:hypothetical protein